MKITFISDTHTKHDLITNDLPGGDLLIHAGDIMDSGYNENDISSFLNWFESIEGYDKKIFIVGNHDRLFENDPEYVRNYLKNYPNITYLQDESCEIHDIKTDKTIKIYGSPWQPWFYDWAFNIRRNSDELKEKWDAIPEDTDILITHGPAYGFVDTVESRPYYNLGCELLTKRINQIQPKIHVCGHIHSGYGVKTNNNTHFINASVLNERYKYTQKPWNVEWDYESNTIEII